MPVTDNLAGRILPRNVDAAITVSVTGENLTGAQMVAYFKDSLFGADSTAVKKGSESPLTGITLDTATDSLIEATIDLTAADTVTLAPLTTKELYSIVYAIVLEDASGNVIPVSDNKFKIKLTAIQAL